MARQRAVTVCGILPTGRTELPRAEIAPTWPLLERAVVGPLVGGGPTPPWYFS
jgi:hypothetical protein